MTFLNFLNKLARLRVDRSKGSPAPHKAILLLSVIQSIELGEITENKIFITPELVGHFKDNWHCLVKSDIFTANFSLPFYHLKGDGFWYLKTFPGMQILLTSSGSVKSFSGLKSAVAYATIDDEIYCDLNTEEFRAMAKQILCATYFNGCSAEKIEYNIRNRIEDQILHEPKSDYAKKIETSDEEEIFVRNGIFKKVVPRVYDYTCCVSGMKIVATRDIQMIDACHIVPFSESHDDTIKNGISLSPNIHRAFDRFLLSIDENYEVIVSEQFTELGSYPIRHFHGKKIYLPNQPEYYPAKQNLNWHLEKFRQLHEKR